MCVRVVCTGVSVCWNTVGVSVCVDRWRATRGDRAGSVDAHREKRACGHGPEHAGRGKDRGRVEA